MDKNKILTIGGGESGRYSLRAVISDVIPRSHCCLEAPVRRDACHTSVKLPLARIAVAKAELEEAATTASDKDHHTSRPLLLALVHFLYLNPRIDQLQTSSRPCCHCAVPYSSSSPGRFSASLTGVDLHYASSGVYMQTSIQPSYERSTCALDCR